MKAITPITIRKIVSGLRLIEAEISEEKGLRMHEVLVVVV